MIGRILLNRWIAFIFILAGCSLLGVACGALLYVIALTAIPESSEFQRRFVFFIFAGLGLLIGLHASIFDLVKNWRYVSDLQNARKSSGHQSEHR